MNRIDRLQAILIHLQSKKIVTAQEIADRFEISIRTVYRDIRALEQAGVPIGAEAGIGYFIADNYHLPPIMFNNEEAVALLIGNKFVEQMADSPTKKACQSAMLKIRSVLHNTEKNYIEQLDNNIVIHNYSNYSTGNQSLFLAEIQKSLVLKQVLNISYHSKYKNEKIEREIEPIGLCFYGNQWHLFAYCQLRNEYRDFRLDRIQKLEPANSFFKEKKHKTLHDIFEQMNDRSDLQKIRFKMNSESYKFISETKYWYGFSKSETCNDQTILEFYNSDINGFASWLLTLGANISILEPSSLQTIIQQKVTDLCYNYLKI